MPQLQQAARRPILFLAAQDHIERIALDILAILKIGREDRRQILVANIDTRDELRVSAHAASIDPCCRNPP
jgi:hypothetical protein